MNYQSWTGMKIGPLGLAAIMYPVMSSYLKHKVVQERPVDDCVYIYLIDVSFFRFPPNKNLKDRRLKPLKGRQAPRNRAQICTRSH